jgi:predicted Zn-dependent protease with MMP-like domain
VIDVTRDEFEELVVRAMDAVPPPFSALLDDEVGVVVEDRAPARMGSLYGLYQGVPRTSGRTPPGMLPARISIYMHPLLDVVHTPEQLVEQVRITLLHELGHHLGMDEDQLDRLGYG